MNRREMLSGLASSLVAAILILPRPTKAASGWFHVFALNRIGQPLPRSARVVVTGPQSGTKYTDSYGNAYFSFSKAGYYTVKVTYGGRTQTKQVYFTGIGSVPFTF